MTIWFYDHNESWFYIVLPLLEQCIMDKCWPGSSLFYLSSILLDYNSCKTDQDKHRHPSLWHLVSSTHVSVDKSLSNICKTTVMISSSMTNYRNWKECKLSIDELSFILSYHITKGLKCSMKWCGFWLHHMWPLNPVMVFTGHHCALINALVITPPLCVTGHEVLRTVMLSQTPLGESHSK